MTTLGLSLLILLLLQIQLWNKCRLVLNAIVDKEEKKAEAQKNAKVLARAKVLAKAKVHVKAKVLASVKLLANAVARAKALKVVVLVPQTLATIIIRAKTAITKLTQLWPSQRYATSTLMWTRSSAKCTPSKRSRNSSIVCSTISSRRSASLKASYPRLMTAATTHATVALNVLNVQSVLSALKYLLALDQVGCQKTCARPWPTSLKMALTTHSARKELQREGGKTTS